MTLAMKRHTAETQTRAAVSLVQGILAGLTLLVMLCLVGCGGGSTANVQNPPPPTQLQVSVAFQDSPVTTLPINTTADLTVVVTNDPGSYGVDWSLTCQVPGSCGALSAMHSDSGQPVVYTPPASIPGNRQAVTIVAFATADHSQNVGTTITVDAFGNALKGTYVFNLQGTDAGNFGYQLTGAIALDGNGTITAGQQTVNFIDPDGSGNYRSLTTPIVKGSFYFVGPDGSGTLSLNTTDQNKEAITEQFAFRILSASEASITDLSGNSFSTGTMQLQTGVGVLAGGYAFVSSGFDNSLTTGIAAPLALGGILNVDSAGAISSKESLADFEYDPDLSRTGSLNNCKPSGTVSQPDPNPFGIAVFDLAFTGDFNCPALVELTGYFVDSTHLKLIETDNGASFTVSGVAIAQGAATGTFDLASFSGPYVWNVQGTETSDLDFFGSQPQPFSLTSTGVVNPDGSGTLGLGFADTLMLQGNFDPKLFTEAPLQISSEFSGTYQIDAKSAGRVRASFKNYNPVPDPVFNNSYIFYLTGNGGLALVLQAGGADPHDPGVGVGIAYPQARPLTVDGKYGVSFRRNDGSGEVDGIGRITVDSTTSPPSFSGSASLTGVSGGSDLAGTVAPAADAHGRLTGTLDISNDNGSTTSSIVFYPIDSNHGFFIETDLLDPSLLSPRVASGSYFLRTPVCAGCE